MILNSFIPQVVMLVLAGGILFSYVQPTFAKIGLTQNAIQRYQIERQKVSDVNQKLADLVAKVNNIPTEDQRALMTYMPDTVDHVAVSRDFFTIAKTSEVYLASVRYEGAVLSTFVDQSESKDNPVLHAFNLNVSGTYDQIKTFLSLLEQNNYPLEVHNLKIVGAKTGALNAEIKVITYSHK